jgi:hypothetical protein
LRLMHNLERFRKLTVFRSGFFFPLLLATYKDKD